VTSPVDRAGTLLQTWFSPANCEALVRAFEASVEAELFVGLPFLSISSQAAAIAAASADRCS